MSEAPSPVEAKKLIAEACDLLGQVVDHLSCAASELRELELDDRSVVASGKICASILSMLQERAELRVERFPSSLQADAGRARSALTAQELAILAKRFPDLPEEVPDGRPVPRLSVSKVAYLADGTPLDPYFPTHSRGGSR